MAHFPFFVSQSGSVCRSTLNVNFLVTDFRTSLCAVITFVKFIRWCISHRFITFPLFFSCQDWLCAGGWFSLFGFEAFLFFEGQSLLLCFRRPLTFIRGFTMIRSRRSFSCEPLSWSRGVETGGRWVEKAGESLPPSGRVGETVSSSRWRAFPYFRQLNISGHGKCPREALSCQASLLRCGSKTALINVVPDYNYYSNVQSTHTGRSW